MIIRDVLDAEPERRFRKRVGRGIGSGRGKTCTRGTKGQGSRSGSGNRGLLEGGQMPLFRRLPHRGFNNARFRGVPFATVNVGQLDARFEPGETVNLDSLRKKGLVKKNASRIKILGAGELTKKLQIEAHALSQTARGKIEAVAGTVQEVK